LSRDQQTVRREGYERAGATGRRDRAATRRLEEIQEMPAESGELPRVFRFGEWAKW
jgi:hypothetical protein